MKALAEDCKNNEDLSDQQQELISAWLEDYEEWKEKQESNARLKSRRQERASNSLAFLIVGMPLFLYHWAIIKKETKA